MIALSFSSSDDPNGAAPESPDPFVATQPDGDSDPVLKLPANPDPSDFVFVLSSDSESWSSPPAPIGGPAELTFRFNIRTALTLRGPRLHFQLALNGHPLYHSKLKRRAPRVPTGISTGYAAHFSQGSFAGFLYPKNKNQKILVTDGSAERVPLLAIEFRPTKGSTPKEIECDLVQQGRTFVSRKASQQPNGRWGLSFGGKIAVPSVKNCVLVDAAHPETIALRMRRVSETDCELDSLGVFDPLLVFGYAMAAFVNRI
jgi:hypothetical protein